MKILMLGGDKRQEYAAKYIEDKNIPMDIWNGNTAFETIKESLSLYDAIILPLPVSGDGITLNVPQTIGEKPKLSEIISSLNKNSLIIGGKFTPALKNIISGRGMRFIDYFENEDFQIKNAVLSAEGAIFYAMEALERSVISSETAVLGYGRIGKLLAERLKCLGANVTVCARKVSDLAWAECRGFKTLQIRYSDGKSSLSELKGYDIIFNTVPCWIFDDFSASGLSSDSLIIDLASAPYGIDEKIVKKYGINYKKISGIPGKYAPVSAGEIIGQTIIMIIEREEMFRC